MSGTSGPVGLRDAAAQHLVPITLDALRKARNRDASFPKAIGHNGQEALYDRGELAAWCATRPGPGGKRADAAPARPRTAVERARQHAARMPTATQRAAAAIAAGEGGRLAELWAAEEPAAAWRADVEPGAGLDCPECGGPRRWTGAHTVLLCPARHADGRARISPSPGAVERETAHAEARGRQRAGGSERGGTPAVSDADAAEAFADAYAYRQEFADALGQLGALAHLTPRSRGLLEWFRAEVSKTEAMPPEAALDRLGQLSEQLDGHRLERAGWYRRDVIAGDVIRAGLPDDDDQADEDDDQADQFAEGLGELRPETRPQHPPELVEYWARDAGQRGTVVVPPAPVPGYVPPDPHWRQKATPAERAYWDRITPPRAAIR
jgi:hypothetical protein